MKGFIKSTMHCVDGVVYAYKNEIAFRGEVILLVILLPTGIYFTENHIEIIILIFSGILVLITEIINSAIEAVVDRISKENHILSKHAKDLGAGAVFVSIILLIIVWTLILIN
ncbi:MAG: diacylglycerol kinase [Nanoarchaeales archaeon]|nr:diacylglycerol kinase [Nanoarchaeales archaeon]